MLSWTDRGLLLAAAACVLCGLIPRLRLFRSLFWVAGTLLGITAIFPTQGNPLGQDIFARTAGGVKIPSEILGVTWWTLGAWFVTRLLDLVLRRTIFPDDNQPHARRLFADLAAGLIYVVAFVGIIDTVLKQPIGGVLATSGVLAIVLGLALQNTLADVFSGLAINIEQPFTPGDWITVKDSLEGQVIEVNWRATRIRTAYNDVTILPNSVIAKAIVTNHRRRNEAHVASIGLSIDHSIAPAHVIGILEDAARASPGISADTHPTAYASRFADALVAYELDFAIDDFALIPGVRSDIIRRVTDSLRGAGIGIGAPATEVRLLAPRTVAAGAIAPPTESARASDRPP